MSHSKNRSKIVNCSKVVTYSETKNIQVRPRNNHKNTTKIR